MLQLNQLTLAAAPDSKALLHGVQLNLGKGELLALVGPSGAGKTCLLRAIAGELLPNAGTIRVGGNDPAQFNRHDRARTGLIAQNHDLVDALRVDRNVMVGALGRWSTWHALRYFAWSSPAETAEAEAALTAVGLSGMGQRKTATLSGGERQRVAIARALVQAPDLLLADEPVASLDPENANRILDLLVKLARERGMTLICALHQPELAERYFTRIATLQDGKLVMRG